MNENEMWISEPFPFYNKAIKNYVSSKISHCGTYHAKYYIAMWHFRCQALYHNVAPKVRLMLAEALDIVVSFCWKI